MAKVSSVFCLYQPKFDMSSKRQAAISHRLRNSTTCLQVLTKAGLLGPKDTVSQLTEYFSTTGQSVDKLTEAQRHERFSFAVARTLDITQEQLQELLAMTSTAKRLTSVYDTLADGRGYLAARSTLKDMF